ncbi:MAG: Fic family protein [Bacteroidales bacterium]|jgi:Fic family protein|nr:Fic family protein [Bacteroidales bacterium]
MTKIPQLYKEWQALQPLNPKLERDINQQFMIDFNYNSNHLEGNTLTYGQTKLLLLFGDTIGNASMQDYEEMKAHNVGLELMKVEAKDKNRMLSENFIRELNQTILVRDFYKTSRDGDYRYKINVGVYKTRPNSVITPTGESFDYASPEETPSLMSDLVEWYRSEEQKGKLKVEELAAMFHYRYIRIHPFEDGNGRIARLLVNYILLRNDYPMLVIRTDDRQNYLKALHQCDQITGAIPYDGAHATPEQTKPLVDYISMALENKLTKLIQFAKGEIEEFAEAIDTSKQDILKAGKYETEEKGTEKGTEKITQNQKTIIDSLSKNPYLTSHELSVIVGIRADKIRVNLSKLKAKGIIERIGGDKGGFWEIKNS